MAFAALCLYSKKFPATAFVPQKQEAAAAEHISSTNVHYTLAYPLWFHFTNVYTIW